MSANSLYVLRPYKYQGSWVRKKPLSEFTRNDLRVAFSQQIGADLVKSRALEILENEPAAGDLYEGDLLLAVMRSRQFRGEETFWKRIILVADAALRTELDSATRDEIQSLKVHGGSAHPVLPSQTDRL